MSIKNLLPRTLLATLLLTFGGAFASKIADPGPIPWGRVALGAFLCLIGVLLQLYTVSVYRRFRTSRLRKNVAEQRKVLVLFLSYVPEAVPSFVELTGNLEDDLASLADKKRARFNANERPQFWSWEQILRGIHHNRKNDGPLERIVLIASKQSVVQIHEFADMVFRSYPHLENSVRIQAYPSTTRRVQDLDRPAVKWVAENGFDFEDFDLLTEALDDVIRQLKNDGVKTSDVQIDLTGGQKVTSVVAAVVTLFSHVSNQYVSTNPKSSKSDPWEYEVCGYDFREERVPQD